MGSILSKFLQRMPLERFRDLTRTTLLLRRLSETEMFRHGITWIETTIRISSNNSLDIALSQREENE